MVGPRTKGVSFLGLLESLDPVCGPGSLERTLRELPTEMPRSWIASGWYPVDDFRRLHETAAKALGRGPDLAFALAHNATQSHFRGIYRTLAFVLSPAFLMRRAPSVFGRYYDTGSMDVPVARDGYGEARFRGCRGFNKCLWQDAIGGTVGVLEACGARKVVPKIVRGGDDGDENLELQVSWT